MQLTKYTAPLNSVPSVDFMVKGKAYEFDLISGGVVDAGEDVFASQSLIGRVALLREINLLSNTPLDYNAISAKSITLAKVLANSAAALLMGSLPGMPAGTPKIDLGEGTLAYDADMIYYIDPRKRVVLEGVGDDVYELEVGSWSCEHNLQVEALLEIAEAILGMLMTPVKPADQDAFYLATHELYESLVHDLVGAHNQMSLNGFAHSEFGRTIRASELETVYRHMRATNREISALTGADKAYYHQYFKDSFLEPSELELY
ncbi:hypothetical protein [Neptuniibacter sp. QD37_11]|uniref:hypothetical protein n=1 Tax=Neptuniibacter sp. QD37_11 TaxID=3398209 RepID=UPI0039F48242